MATGDSRAVDPIERLGLELGRLPGIGARTATRLAQYIVLQSHRRRAEPGKALGRELAQALLNAVDQVQLCERCQTLCVGALCSVCSDARRDEGLLCVVERVADQRAMEATGSFRGGYHVLHGALSPLDGIGPEELKIQALMERLKLGNVKEVILATNANVEGDATALYLAQLLQSLPVRVTRLASGIPMGGELEYLDKATLERAMSERRAV